jgi:hypothetical protein
MFDAPDGTYRVYDTEKDVFACFTASGLICTIFGLRVHNLTERQIAEFLDCQGTPIGHIPKPAPPSKQPQRLCDYFCPVCGFATEDAPPPYMDGFASYEICPACSSLDCASLRSG